MRDTKLLIGFVGQGWIGKNYADNFERRGFRTVRYALEEPYIQNKERIKECDFVFIAVPTPTTPEGFDYSIVRAGVALVAPGKVAVVKSTILPGTTKEIQREFPDRVVVYSPEFLSVATAAHDTAFPFSTIIGIAHNSPKHKEAARELLAVLPRAPFDLVCTSTEAEIVKYSHNGAGFAQVVFYNMMYDLALTHGCDWKAVQRALDADPMVSNWYTRPIHKSGRGAGGVCFIKDVAALRKHYQAQTGDAEGGALFEAMEDRNTSLLLSTGKDLDLLSGVYGQDVLGKPVSPFQMPALSSVRGDTRVLVCTEMVDRADPLLGFFHRWVEEFARHASEVHVVCLGWGERELPPNVREHTLGKERLQPMVPRLLRRVLYGARLLRHAWRNRRGYDTVLVHTSSEFVLAASLLWKLLGKRIGFWYNDSHGAFLARVACRISDILFYSHPDSYAARFAHARRVPMGVDTRMYEHVARTPSRGSLLFAGRIAPKKRLDVILSALAHLPKIAFVQLDIYGTPRPGEESYLKDVRSKFADLERAGRVAYCGTVLHEQTPDIYASHDVFVHAGSLRGFNKSLLEAMAAGCLIVTCERDMRALVDPRLFVEDPTPECFAAAISAALALTEEEAREERLKLQAYARREHALSSVVPAMLEMLSRTGGERFRGASES